MRRRFATSSSTLTDRDAVVRGLIRERVRSVPVLAKLTERAQDHVSSDSRLTAQSIASEQIVCRA
jgi:hypothetical protein